MKLGTPMSLFFLLIYKNAFDQARLRRPAVDPFPSYSRAVETAALCWIADFYLRTRPLSEPDTLESRVNGPRQSCVCSVFDSIRGVLESKKLPETLKLWIVSVK